LARVKRPSLDRESPIRSWASAISPEPRAGARNESVPNHQPALDPQDPIVRGVVSGGRVVDEWIRQAQQAARLLGGSASTAGWADASGKVFKASSDLMAAWWSIVGGLQSNGGPGFGGQPGPSNHESAWQARSSYAYTGEPAGPPSSPDRISPSAVSHVRLEVVSRRPVDVLLELHRRGVTRFRILDLRPERDDAPRIPGAALEPWNVDGLHLRLVVPDDQPPGVYHAVVLDAIADCAAGTVTLRIPV
jgi:hypothetical protein